MANGCASAQARRKIHLRLALHEPARRYELCINLIAGNLFGVLVQHAKTTDVRQY